MMASDSKSDVSRGYRFQAGLPAVLYDQGREHSCTAHDLSRTGVLLVGELPKPSASKVEFAIRTPAGDLEQRFTGRVARFERGEGAEETRIGLALLPLDPGRQQSLEIFLARVMEGMAPAPIEAIGPGATPAEIRKALESVPLAHRIALAARAGQRAREHLRHDPHPQVLESLVRNPRLLPAEARALADVPCLLSSTLEILASDRRWSKDDKLKILIATHPHVPIPLAERLAGALDGRALRKMLARPSINADLREEIVKRLAPK
jgi:hypothetical protein